MKRNNQKIFISKDIHGGLTIIVCVCVGGGGLLGGGRERKCPTDRLKRI